MLSGQIRSGNAAFAYTLIGLQRGTLGAMLGHALDHRAWDDASGIVRALDEYWDARGLSEEAAGWADRILAATASPGEDRHAVSLWVYTSGRQGNRQHQAGKLRQAAQTFQRVLAYLRDQPATNWIQQSIAVTYHQLGLTAQASGQLDEAEDWYRKSLTINEELGIRPIMASTYHQLGTTALDRGQLDEADSWYRKSLTIKEELRDRPGVALTYHELGMTAQNRERLDDAENWYRKSLSISQELGIRPYMATTTTSSA